MSEDIRNDTQPRVLICLPVYSGMHPWPFFHFMQMQRHHTICEQAGLFKTKLICPGPRMKIQYVRNAAVDDAVRSNATHLLFLDDDFVCPEDTLLRLLAHDVDVVGPLFFRGGGDFAPMIFKWEDRETGRNLYTFDKWEPNTLMEVDAIGTGCLLIKMDVFRKVGAPFFYYPEATMERTMDVHFCVRAKARGVQIYCDTSFECGQLGLPPLVTSQNFLEAQMGKMTGGSVDEEKSRPSADFAEVRG